MLIKICELLGQIDQAKVPVSEVKGTFSLRSFDLLCFESLTINH